MRKSYPRLGLHELNRGRFCASITAALVACLLVGTQPARAQFDPVVLVPVITDPADAPRLLALAKVLRGRMADRDLPSVAARYTATLKDAKDSGDAFALALDLGGEFATLRYNLYSDELVRAHAVRLLELAKAQTAILLAAPVANRIILKRITKDDGQSVALPDPCSADVAQRALADLLPVEKAARPLQPSEARGASRTSKWLSRAAALIGTGAAAAAVALSARRRTFGTRFQDTVASETGYLSRGDHWRALRAPMLASASVAAASLSLGAVAFAVQYDQRKLLWLSVPAAAVGAAALAWAAADLAQGGSCAANAGAICVREESQLDRGILLTLLAAPPIALATTHLSRWLHHRIRMRVDAFPHLAAVSMAYRY